MDKKTLLAFAIGATTGVICTTLYFRKKNEVLEEANTDYNWEDDSFDTEDISERLDNAEDKEEFETILNEGFTKARDEYHDEGVKSPIPYSKINKEDTLEYLHPEEEEEEEEEDDDIENNYGSQDDEGDDENIYWITAGEFWAGNKNCEKKTLRYFPNDAILVDSDRNIINAEATVGNLSLLDFGAFDDVQNEDGESMMFVHNENLKEDFAIIESMYSYAEVLYGEE